MKHLTACLALRSNEHDKAIGINWPSRRTAGLLWYYNQLERQAVGKVAAAAYLNNIIQQGKNEIKMLVARAEKAKDKHKIARRVIAVQERIEEAALTLKKLRDAPDNVSDTDVIRFKGDSGGGASHHPE